MPTKPAAAERSSGQIRSVQALRAIAALFVVGFHSTVLCHDKFAPDAPLWMNGNSGVDLFFVISGFIMAISSRRLLEKAHGWRTFMVLRLVRIVPMYWLATATKLIAVTALPTLALRFYPTDWNTVASFIFVPSRDGVGVIRPVIDVGWTLSFEMLFYLAFASALFFLVKPLLVVGPTMAALAMLSLARTSDPLAIETLASPIVLEFVFGVIIAQAFLGGWLQRLSSPWMIAVTVAGLLGLALLPTGDNWDRVAVWGLGAAAALTGAILTERWLDRVLPRHVVRIGEASYSLYLTHGFVLPVVGLVIAKSGLKGHALEGALIASCLLASTFVALVAYRLVEVPVTEWLRLLVGDRRRTSLVVPQAAI